MPTISASPPHNPSMLSSRLNALIMPTTQISVSIVSMVSDTVQFRRKPNDRNTDAIAI